MKKDRYPTHLQEESIERRWIYAIESGLWLEETLLQDREIIKKRKSRFISEPRGNPTEFYYLHPAIDEDAGRSQRRMTRERVFQEYVIPAHEAIEREDFSTDRLFCEMDTEIRGWSPRGSTYLQESNPLKSLSVFFDCENTRLRKAVADMIRTPELYGPPWFNYFPSKRGNNLWAASLIWDVGGDGWYVDASVEYTRSGCRQARMRLVRDRKMEIAIQIPGKKTDLLTEVPHMEALRDMILHTFDTWMNTIIPLTSDLEEDGRWQLAPNRTENWATQWVRDINEHLSLAVILHLDEEEVDDGRSASIYYPLVTGRVLLGKKIIREIHRSDMQEIPAMMRKMEEEATRILEGMLQEVGQ